MEPSGLGAWGWGQKELWNGSTIYRNREVREEK